MRDKQQEEYIYPLPKLPKFLCFWFHKRLHTILAVEVPGQYTELEEIEARLMGRVLKRYWVPVLYCKRCRRRFKK
jgi:hypothetical protein